MKDIEIDRMAEFEEGYWWFVGRRNVIEIILNKQINKRNLRILDVGCGTGNTTLSLKKFGGVYCTDSSFSALRYCNKRGLENVVKSSSYNLPYSSNTFDLVTMFDVLEHIENDQRALIEIKRVLKKNGSIVITVPAYQFLWSEHDIALSHYRRYNSKTLSNVVNQTGFKIVRMSYFISFLFPFIAAYRIIGRLKKMKTNPKANLRQLPAFVDKLFQSMLVFESKILQYSNFPFGLSVVCIAKINSSKSIP